MAKMMELGIKLSMLMSGNYDAKLTKASRQIEELTRKTQGLTKTKSLIDQYRKSQQDQTNLYEKLNKQGWTDEKLLKQWESKGQEVEKYRRKLEEAGISVKNLASNESRLASELSSSQSKLERLSAAQARYNEARSKLLDWGQVKGDFMAVAGYVNMFQKPIKLAADFESAMARVQAAGFVRKGSDMSQLEELRKQALNLGDTTKYTSIEAAATQEVLIRGGVKVPDVLKMMPTVMSLATAENMELNRAAEILVTMMTNLNAKAEDVSSIADTLTIMSASYKTNANDMYETLRQFAGTAANLKIPLKDMAALAAIGQQMGVTPEALGTGLKTGLLSLSKPTKEARIAMKQLGVTVEDAKGHLRNMPEFLRELYTKLQKYGPVKQTAILGTIFGKRQADTWTKLALGAGRGLVDEAVTINETEAAGTTQKMEAIIMQTYNGNKALFDSALSGLQTWIGDKIKPIQEYVMNKATSAISTVTQTAKANESISAPLTQAAFLGGGAFAGYKIASYAGKAIEFGKAWLGLKAVESAAAGVATATATAATGAASTVSAVEGVASAATGTAGAIESIGTAAGSAAQGVASGASSMLASLSAVSALVMAIYNNWQQFKQEGIHMHDQLIQMKSVQGSNRDRSLSAGNNTFGGRKRALGGVITRPEIALIGEAGPEAVIPLSPGKKSRGLQMLTQAASSLGVNIMTPEMRNVTDQITNNTSQSNIYRSIEYGNDLQNVSSSSDIVRQSESLITNDNRRYGNSARSYGGVISPSINITVNAGGSELSEGTGRSIAEDISSRVREVLSELMNDSDRLSYA